MAAHDDSFDYMMYRCVSRISVTNAVGPGSFVGFINALVD